MKTIKKLKLGGLLLAVVMAFMLNTNANASNIQIPTEPSIEVVDAGIAIVTFCLTWEFSWRSTQLRNWDGAWVFVKYRIGMDHWDHMFLDPLHNPQTGYTSLSGGVMAHEYGFSEDVDLGAVGVFLFRQDEGHGDIHWENISLRWRFDRPGTYVWRQQPIREDDEIIVRVFAIEMVFVPEGRFFLGDGQNQAGNFTRADRVFNPATGVNQIMPFQVTSEATPIGIAFRADNEDDAALLAGQLSAVGLFDDVMRPTGHGIGEAGTTAIPAAFPKGYRAFWIMKYEITQGAYVDFLNTLTVNQQGNRIRGEIDAGANVRVMVAPEVAPAGHFFPGSVAGATPVATVNQTGDRNAIRVRTPGVIEFAMDMNGINHGFPTTHTAGAGGFGVFDQDWDGHGVASAMGPGDVLAFLDWAGLRPMTELEFEKASRGPLAPIPGEFPWGATFERGALPAGSVAEANARITDRGLPTEVVNSVTNPTTVNHNNTSLAGTAAAQIAVQVLMVTRNGAFATPTSDRIKAGATFWGVMEMGSNLAEPVINVNTAAGRAFTGRHGDGRLSFDGEANVALWPEGPLFNGMGYRGGNIANGQVGGGLQTLSQRSVVQNNWTVTHQGETSGAGHRFFTGGRGVRTAGVTPPSAPDSPGSGTDTTPDTTP